MKCAIMQPTYLPWAGYFNLIANVDQFVFLDDVQFERRSWQVRNRILVNGQEHMLSVPVKKCAQETRLDEVELSSETDWKKRHWLTLVQAYGKAPFGAQALSLLETTYHQNETRCLVDFNVSIITAVASALDLDARTYKASSLGAKGARSEHLLEICKRIECDGYLSPQGSREYLMEDRFADNGGVSLEFQSFSPRIYSQFRSNLFVSHLSIVDVIANLGIERSRDYVRN